MPVFSGLVICLVICLYGSRWERYRKTSPLPLPQAALQVGEENLVTQPAPNPGFSLQVHLYPSQTPQTLRPLWDRVIGRENLGMPWRAESGHLLLFSGQPDEGGHVDPPFLPQPHVFTSLKPKFLPELEEVSLRGGLQASQNLKEVLEPLVCIKHPSQSLLPSCK